MQSPMQDILGAFVRFMDEQRANQGRQGATKALKSVVTKVGRFDSNNVSKFLRAYVYEIEVHQIDEFRMTQTFDMAVMPEIRDRI